jgi:1,4-alpha-glucan branching enzyme
MRLTAAALPCLGRCSSPFWSSDIEHSVWQTDGWFEHLTTKKWVGSTLQRLAGWTEVGERNRPDYGRSEVREFIRDNVLWWLEEYRIDGLRWDMVCGIRNVFAQDRPPGDPTNLEWGWNLLKWVNDEVDARQPWKPMIAEDMRQNAAITRPTSFGGAGFDSQWDDQFHHVLRRAMVTPSDHDRNVNEVRGAIERRFDGDACKR